MTKTKQGPQKVTINGKTYRVQIPSAMWQLEQMDAFVEKRTIKAAEELLNTMLENTITDPPGLKVDSFELPPDETVEIGGLEFKFHHPGVPWQVWAATEYVGPNQQLRRSAFLRGCVEHGVISGASPEDLRSLVEINQLITVVNEFLDQAELWQLYYHLFFRDA
jgi:hypothetical protein